VSERARPAGEPEPARPQPVLRVVRGRPTADELAALVVVLAARSANASDVDGPRPRSGWADPARRLRAAVRPGPDAWRRSALPG
jgi:hypothetical protein